jgi:hypothetical protein
MKRILYASILVFTLSSVHAQDRFIKADGGLGTAITLGELKSYGISASFEPKFFFNKRISAGLRMEGDVLFGGSLSGDAGTVSVSTSSRAAFLVKGEYYFSENQNRLFVGLMVGRYTQANSGVEVNGNSIPDSSLSAVRSFGFAPEFGVTLNNFRLSAIYHVVTGEDQVSVSTGNGVKVNRSYLVLQLGFKIFQVNL